MGTEKAKKPLSKDEFVKIIEDLREADDVVNQVNKILWGARNNISNDFLNGSALSISHEAIVGRLLEHIFDDAESGWISYWIWETDYGRNINDDSVTEADGTPIPLKTPDQLYDLLVKNLEVETKA